MRSQCESLSTSDLLAFLRNVMYHEVTCEVYNDSVRVCQQVEIFTGLH